VFPVWAAKFGDKLLHAFYLCMCICKRIYTHLWPKIDGGMSARKRKCHLATILTQLTSQNISSNMVQVHVKYSTCGPI
jgi:hypothetical protein